MMMDAVASSTTAAEAAAQRSTLLSLTSTTAPGKTFDSRAELAEHYKSDWHRYNLKRRESGLPVLLQTDFDARWQAAKALRESQSTSASTKQNTKKQHQQHQKKRLFQSKAQPAISEISNQQSTAISTEADLHAVSPVDAHLRIQDGDKGERGPVKSATNKVVEALSTMQNDQAISNVFIQDVINVDETEAAKVDKLVETKQDAAEMTIDIDPHQSLFDHNQSVSVTSNLQYMQKRYGFFIPDREFLIDMSGLIGYCHEKITLGHICLYCQRAFGSAQACQKHMIDLGHTKLRYEDGIDLGEFDVFYDFSRANAEFQQSISQAALSSKGQSKVTEQQQDAQHEDESDWEDMSEDEQDGDNPSSVDDDDDDDDVYSGYQEEVARMGLDVTPLGELIFPDGRIIGHRALRRYYKQRLPASRSQQDSVAVLAAKQAARERLHRGCVYELPSPSPVPNPTAQQQQHDQELMVAAMHHRPSWAASASGRAGKGILVPVGTAAATTTIPNYTQLSIYRYRAAVRKQRFGQSQGQRLYQRTYLNMNRMDKKHNRLMNGVSVAHAAR